MDDAHAKYGSAWLREYLADKSFLPNHDCSLCGVAVGYLIDGEYVSYQSACDCSWKPDRPSNFFAIADWLAMQSSDDIRDKILERAQ